MNATQKSESQIIWRPAPCLPGIELLEVSQCSQDWTVAHGDTFTFCVVQTTDPRGGGIAYRRWSQGVFPGDLQLFEPGEVHRAVTRGYPSSFCVVQIPAEQVRRAWHEQEMTGAGPHFKSLVSRTLYHWFFTTIRIIGSPAIEKLQAQSALTEALVALLTDENVCERSAAHGAADILRTRRAKEYIDACIDGRPWEAPHLDEIVAAASVRGRFALCRDFKKLYGISPWAYVKARKVHLARKLLRRGLEVSMVARQTGYTLPAFSRAFSAHVGVTPSDYRSAFAR